MPFIFWLWLAAAVVFLIVEITTPTLVFACFTVGSVGSAAVAFFYPQAYLWQVAVFAIISIILIPSTRSLARRITKPSPQKTNVDAIIGQTGTVMKKIDPDSESGLVRVEGQIWQARADNIIDEGRKVKILSVSGARLFVTENIG